MNERDQMGQILIRFGATQPGRETLETDMLRDFQDYCDNLRVAALITAWQGAMLSTGVGGYIILTGRLDQLLRLPANINWTDWMVKLRFVFTPVTVDVAQGGTNGSMAGYLDHLEDVNRDMNRRLAGATAR